jgi:acyl carrier protein
VLPLAQVKIHGFRIELSEIVTAVLLHPALTRAEVTLVGDQLVAFVTPGVGADVVAEAAALAKKTLPAYMLPRRIIPLPDFPLTKNGKLDRGAMLAAADAAERAAPEAAVPLATEAQRRVAEVWAAVTERPAGEVFANSSFFDLGGSSLTAIAMAAAVKAALGVALPPTAVFGAPTVAEFAAAVEAAAGKEAV